MAERIDHKQAVEAGFSNLEVPSLNDALDILRIAFQERVEAVTLANGEITFRILSKARMNAEIIQSQKIKLVELRQSQDFSFESCDEETRRLFMDPAHAELISEEDLATLWALSESNFKVYKENHMEQLSKTLTHPKVTAPILNRIAMIFVTSTAGIKAASESIKRNQYDNPFAAIMNNPLVDPEIKKTIFRTDLFIIFYNAIADTVSQIIDELNFSADEVQDIFKTDLSILISYIGKSRHVTDPSLYNLYLESGDDNAILSICLNPHIADDVKELAKGKLSPTTRGYLESGIFE